MSIVLRPFQEDIINQARSLMKKGVKSILIQAPCGAGKTVLTAYMMKAASEKQMQSWFIVHRRELLNQSANTFKKISVPFGYIASGHKLDAENNIHICLIGSIKSRRSKVKDPSLIIYDEAHHIGAATWTNLYKEFPNSFHIGLTATPERTDGKGLKDYFSEMILGPKYNWLIENKYLSPYKYYAPSDVDLSKVHTRMGDFVSSELDGLVNTRVMVGNAVTEYLKYCDGKRAIVFCASIDHSINVADEFISRGIKAMHIDSDTDQSTREQTINDLSAGNIKVLCNVDLFGEGVSVDSVEAVIMLRPTQSLGLFIQQAGRALRTFPGKDHAIILDHVGNYKRHGLPDDDRKWSLDGNAKKKSKTESIKICEKCFAAIKFYPCFCGFSPQVTSRDNTPEIIHGTLTEVKKQNPLWDKLDKVKLQAEAKTYEDLCELGKSRGYKNYKAWAYFVFNSRKKRSGK